MRHRHPDQVGEFIALTAQNIEMIWIYDIILRRLFMGFSQPRTQIPIWFVCKSSKVLCVAASTFLVRVILFVLCQKTKSGTYYITQLTGG